MRQGRSRRTFAGVGLAALLLVGCEGDDPARSCTQCDEGMGPAATENQLVANLVASWQDQDLPAYERLLHEDFVFHFAWVYLKRDYPYDWTREEDLLSAERIFTGQEGQDDGGELVSPVNQLYLEMTPLDDSPWEDQIDEFAGTQMKMFEIAMDVFYADGSIMEVTGFHEFYVQDVASEESESANFVLRAWRDQGKELDEGNKTEQHTWSRLKGQFRDRSFER